MRKLWALALLVFFGGCLPAEDPYFWSRTQQQTAPADPAVSAAAQGAPLVSDIPPSVTADDSSAEQFPTGVELAEPDQGQAFIPEEAPAVDPETLEDNRLLTGAGQLPPEDEGETVPAEKVVFDFPVVENDKVRYFIDYYTGPGRRTFARWLQRSGRYLPMMRQIFAEEGLPLDLAYLAMVESGFNDRAYSWAHAVGPWQFIESTGRMYGLESNWWRDERRDFEKATRSAARFLKDLHRRFDGDWYLAVASYNAGGGKVNGAIRKYRTRDFWELSRGSHLQTETKNYVPKLLAVLQIAKEPAKYGFTDLEFQPPLAYDVVLLPTATDLDVVARLCDVPYEEIKGLNPELKRWCTPPEIKNYPVRVPAGSAQRFTEAYAQLPPADRANYKRHRVSNGDTLLALAQRYNIRVKDIIALNGIKNPRALRIGTDLILPLKKGYSRLPVDEMEDDYVRSRRRTYTVRKGDSLWKIARKFSVSEKELRVWNRLGWSNVIRPGQTLAVSASGAKGRKTTGNGDGAPRKIVYEVRKGDTLWGIGRQFEVATRQIRNWNNLPKNHVLRPGDQLTLLVQARQRS
ncbi:LysM peptidoglycan-binding domain-containing protein [uncultured Desulfuromonas sp.]|uniref:LysM peptidoglycan-binding domain-containing protein n=1 Tax=uncultured Desulfuromonas sp. TaxID=181013 RepID=UPI002617BC83|nr:LysM peptidoglycan-binding domain-containing protein [uncultured Desulfuromonas sp.]